MRWSIIQISTLLHLATSTLGGILVAVPDLATTLHTAPLKGLKGGLKLKLYIPAKYAEYLQLNEASESAVID